MKVSLFKKPEKLTVSQFAEKFVTLQEGACRGQKFSYKNRPYFRDPTDAMGDTTHNCRVVIYSPSQCGKSSSFLNFLYWICEYDQDNVLIILDSQKTADKLMKVRIRPFLQNQVKLESLQKGVQTEYLQPSVNEAGTVFGITLPSDLAAGIYQIRFSMDPNHSSDDVVFGFVIE